MADSGAGAVIQVDPTTGAQSSLSSGVNFQVPIGIAIDDVTGEIFVADTGADAVIRVDPNTGAQTVISSGGSLVDPHGIAIEADGSLIVADQNAGGGPGSVIRVNRSTGAQTVVSTGGNFVDPHGIDVASDGTIYVSDRNTGGSSPFNHSGNAGGALIGVDPATGAQTLINNNWGATGFFDPAGVHVDAGGNVLVADLNSFDGGSDGQGGGVGAVFRIDPSLPPATNRTIVNDGSGTSPLDFESPSDVAVEPDGSILMIDFNGPTPGDEKLFRIDPVTGSASILVQGGLFQGPNGIAVRQELDFGDAPDPTYPTLAASNGARHVLGSGLFLGMTVDAEADGQPDPFATGDDLAGVPDDEDGVVFNTAVVAGSVASITVTASGDGLLDAWVDFNNNGSWADEGEQIFSSESLVAGPNALDFLVPLEATLGPQTFTRFRLSSTGGLTPTGFALDGEVEDYALGSIHGQKFRDSNANGRRDPDEPGLNGYEISAFGSNGASHGVITMDMDLDGVPGIDPITESGLYWLTGLPPDNYFVQEFLDGQLSQTYPARLGASEYSVTLGPGQVLGSAPADVEIISQPGPHWVDDLGSPFIDSFFDVFFSVAEIEIQGGVNSPLGEFNDTFLGAGNTEITRSEPRESDTPGHNDTIDTEMVSLELTSNSPLLGEVRMRVGIDAGVSQPSLGMIQEQADPSVAESFFDVFFEVDTQLGTLHNDVPIRMQADITQVPPFLVPFESQNPVPLFDAAGEPTDLTITSVTHIPSFGLDFGNIGLDFGKADDPTFPTTVASDGARHILGSGLFLGTNVTSESDGPSPDENDGVSFVNVLQPGQTVEVDVTASQAGGLLNAWVDYNGDGDWNDAGEQIFNDVLLAAGENTLTVDVPAELEVTCDTIWTRFRLSSQGGLTPQGLAPDGEVEDYSLRFRSDSITVESLDGPLTATDLATDLVGSGIAVSNVTYTGANVAAGRFTDTGGVTGLSDGVILSSGHIQDVIGPNCVDDITTGHETPGDSDLDVLADFNGQDFDTFDAAVLEFDFVPDDDAVTFSYVFSSDEYNEYVNTSFNDVFAFFVNGVNRATVPIQNAASLSLMPPGDDNDMEISAVQGGTAGNLITVEFIDPGANDSLLSSSVNGNAVTVSLGTDGTGMINSTASEVIGELQITGLVTAQGLESPDGDFNFGGGLVSPLAPTLLTGGGPGGEGPVAVNTINNGNPFNTNPRSNPALFRNNDLDDGGGAIDTEMDGLTVVLSFGAEVTPNQTNTIKIAIADTSDSILDSNVMIEAGSFQSTEIDFGDAPDTYQTLLGDDGARHAIVDGFFLGDPQAGGDVDGDTDGEPSAAADGDDVVDGNDDEDGVVFTSLLTPGEVATLDVTASAAGFLDAWIDYGNDGVFDPIADLVLPGVPIGPGLNQLQFNVPGDLPGGPSYARFRFSDTGGLLPFGFAPIGEVEDYTVTIESGETGSIHGYKFEDLNVNGVDDDTTADGIGDEPRLAGVTITLTGDVDGDGQDETISTVTDANGEYGFEDLAPGDFIVAEMPPFGTFPTTAISFSVTVGANQELVALPGQANLEAGDPEVEVVVGPDLAFGNAFEGSIHGFKFEDINGDGIRQPGEPPLEGVDINLTWQDGQGQTQTDHTHTDDDGEYWFTWLQPGIEYTVTETPPDGSVQTTLPPPPITILSGQEYVVDVEQGRDVQNVVEFPLQVDVEITPVGSPNPELIQLTGMAAVEFEDPVGVGDPGATFDIVDRQHGLPLDVPEGETWQIETELLSMQLSGQDSLGRPVFLNLQDGSDSLGQVTVEVDPATGFLVGDSFFDVFFDITIDDPQSGPMTLTPDAGAVRLGMPFDPQDEIPRDDVRWMPSIFQVNGIDRDLLDEGGQVWDVLNSVGSTPLVELEKPVRPEIEPLLEFGNAFLGSIHGYKFEDLNLDGIDNDATGDGIGDEPRLAGVEITLEGDVDGNTTIDTLTLPTDENGEYWFEGLYPGIYTVTETPPPGSVATTPVSFNVTVNSREELVALEGQAHLPPENDPRVEVVIGPTLAFGNVFEGSIHGYKFEDINGNGIDDGEPRLEGVTITLTGTDAAGQDIDPMSMTTDENGRYWFTGLLPGTYTATETPPAGSVATTPASTTVVLGSGERVAPPIRDTAPLQIEFETEIVSLQLSGGPFPMPLGGDPENVLGDSIDGYGFVDSEVTITLSSQRLPNDTPPGPGPASSGQSIAVPLNSIGAPVRPGELPVVDPGQLDGQDFFVDSFFDVFFDITVTDVDSRPGRDYAGQGDGASVSFVDNGSAMLSSSYQATFDANSLHFGLSLPAEANPFMGTDIAVIPLGGDLNGNGIPDVMKLTAGTFAIIDDPRAETRLPDGTTLLEFDTAALLEGVVLDETSDPPFTLGTSDPASGVPDGNVFGGPTTATSTLVNPVTPQRGVDHPGLAFGNTYLGSIHGYKFEDLNGNGIDDGEPRLANVEINLLGDVDGDGQTDTRHVLTDVNGEYWFVGLYPGDYTVSETFPAGFIPTTPDSYDVTLHSRQELVALDGQAMLPEGDPRVEIVVGPELLVFGNTVPGSIHGFKFEDVDGDGIFTEGIDGPLAGVDFTLTGEDGQGNIIDMTETTDANGEFWFTGLLPSVDGVGSATGYTVSESVPAGFVATTPDSFSTDLLSRQELVALPGQAMLPPPVSATIDFDDVDASGGPITGAALDSYLNQFGVTITDITPSGLGQIVDDRVGFPSQVVRAFSDANVFWHDSPNDPYSYSVNFAVPQGSFTFIRPELFGATESGLIVSPWRARAFDASGALLDTVSEPQLAFLTTVPATSFTLNGPDIASVIFDRTTQNTIAGLNRVPTDNWVLDIPSDPRREVVVGADLMFGNTVPGSVHGFKFEDVDGDGLYEPADGESGLAGVQFRVTGTTGQGAQVDIVTDPTNQQGEFWQVGLLPGDYTVSELVPGGSVATTPSTFDVTIDSREEYVWTDGAAMLPPEGDPRHEVNVGSALMFGNAVLGSIHGYKFEDLNGNGIDDDFIGSDGIGDEPRLQGVEITLTGDVDGNGQSDTRIMFTDSNGEYGFVGLYPGDYTVTETPPSGFVPSTPASYDVTVLSRQELVAQEGQARLSEGDPRVEVVVGPEQLVFGNYVPVEFHGLKFEDLNANGQRESGEPGLPGVTITVSGTDGMGNAVNVSTTTMTDDPGTPEDETGMYWIQDVKPGDYTVAETVPTGWVPSTPASINLGLVDSGTDVFADFGNYRPASVHGRKFHDLDADGVRDPEPIEDFLNGWTIELVDAAGNVVDTQQTHDHDVNGDQLIDPETERGWYWFVGVTPGDYTVREVQEPGWSQSAPATGEYSVTLISGEVVVDRDFGNFLGGRIHGRKFEDLNANGSHDAGEPGLNDWTIELVDPVTGNVVASQTTQDEDRDGNGQFDPPAESGYFLLQDVVPGEYIVREVPQEGWEQSAPVGDEYEVSVRSSGSYPGHVFGNFRPVEIHGLKFDDLNGNGELDSGEPGVPGVTITLSGTDGMGNSVTTSTTTMQDDPGTPEDETGMYWITDVKPGNYTLVEVIPQGTEASTPPTVTLGNLISGDEVFVDFGNYIPIEFHGLKFEDLNANGQQDPGEPGLAGVTITLTGTDGMGNAVNVTTTTMADDPGTPNDETGMYWITGQKPGHYTVAEILDLGWVASTSDSVVVGDVESGDVVFTDFGNYRPVSMHGRKFEDLNGDGVRDEGEEYLDGWTIELVDSQGEVISTQTTHSVDLDFSGSDEMDNDGDGEIDEPDEAIDPETEVGWYWFEQVVPGDYTIREVQQEGWVQTAPAEGTYTITVISGDVQEDLDFGNRRGGGSLHGRKFHDRDADGVRQAGEEWLDEWTIELVDPVTGNVVDTQVTHSVDINNDGQIQHETESGWYWFQNVNPGDYVVREVLQPSWSQSAPSGGEHAITVTSQQDIVGLDFGNFVPAQLHGRKFHDLDADGLRDAGEEWLNGWTIEVRDATGNVVATQVTHDADIDNDGLIDPETERGWYWITVNPGSYTVSEVLQEGDWVQSAPVDPDSYSLTVTSQDSVNGLDFGNYQLASIHGRKFEDVNGDGDRDDGEPYLNEWTVELVDSAGNVVDTQSTHDHEVDGVPGIDPETERGWYWFTGLVPGDYSVRELQQPGWVQTTPGDGGSHAETLISGDVKVDRDFGNAVLGSIHGYKFEDVNGNAEDDGEPRLEGVTITLTGDVDGDGDNDTRSMLTNQQGEYWFEELYPGDYTVTETPKAGTAPTTPASYSVTVLSRQELVALQGQAHLPDLTRFPNGNDPRVEVFVGPQLAFGNQKTTGELSGSKYHDVNANGQRDANEPGIPEFVIQLDLDNDGSVDETDITDHDGNYRFFNVPLGQHKLTEVQQTSYFQSDPGADDGFAHVITLGGGQTIDDLDFGNFQKAVVTGLKYEDLNGNGTRDAGEPGLAGWTIRLHGIDGMGNLVDQTVVTMTDDSGTPEDETGQYVIDAIVPGGYTVSEILQSGWTQTEPAAGSYPLPLASGDVVNGLEFGNFVRGSIHGYKFEDINGNGIDDGEPRLESVQIELQGDVDNDGQLDTITTATNAQGEYWFENLWPGPYTVSETPPAGSVPTTPDTFDVVVQSRQELVALDGQAHLTDPNDPRVEVNISPELAFGNAYLGSIHGYKFFDADGNGEDDGELRLAGVPIELTGDIDGDGQIDTVVVQTDQAGEYGFEGLLPGTYTVRELVPAGFTPTTPALYTVTVDSREELVAEAGQADLTDPNDPRDEVVIGPQLVFGNIFDSLMLDFEPASFPTQAGFERVLRTTAYAPAAGQPFGWLAEPSVNTFASERFPTELAELHRDMIGDQVPQTMRINIPRGSYSVTMNIAQGEEFQVLNGQTGDVLLDGINVADRTQPIHRTFTIDTGANDFMDLQMQGGGLWLVNGLTVRQDTPLDITITGTGGALPADGTTVSNFDVTGLNPGSTYSIGTSLGEVQSVTVGGVTQPDFDGRIAGPQILADVSGNASFSLLHPMVDGTAEITVQEAKGLHAGELLQQFELVFNLLQLDFEPASTPTQAGFQRVLKTTAYDPAAGQSFGWLSVPGVHTVASIRNPTQLAELHRDMIGDNNVARTMRIDIPAGTYTVTMSIADAENFRVVDTGTGTTLLSGFNVIDRVQPTHVTFPVDTGVNSFMELEMFGTGLWLVNGLTVREDTPLDITITSPGQLDADGVTVTDFAVSGLNSGSTYTVSASLGDIASLTVGGTTGTDFDGRLLGQQIVADASGNATISLLHPVIGGTSFIAVREATGLHAGELNQVFDLSFDALQFDFNVPGYPVQAGFHEVLKPTLYNPAAGSPFGWLVSPATHTLATVSSPTELGPLHRDMIGDTTVPRTFQVDVPAGTYSVTISIADAENFQVVDPHSGNDLLSGVNVASRSAPTHRTFSFNTNGNDFLALQMSGNGVWLVNGLTIRDETPEDITITSPGTLEGDGVTVSDFAVSGLNPGSTYSVSTTLGEIVNLTVGAMTQPDFDAHLLGPQILADSSGNATISIRHPSAFGTAQILVDEATGLHFGTLDQNFGLPANGLSFDFQPNGYPLQAGYLQVVKTQVYNPAIGNSFGWLAPAGVHTIASARTPTQFANLTRDMIGENGLTNTFRVDVPAGTYTVTMMIADGEDFTVVDPATSTTLLSGLDVANRLHPTHRTFTFNTGVNEFLELEMSGIGLWLVNGLTIRNDTPVDISISGPGLLPADGATVTDFSVSGLNPGSTYTVTASLGSISSLTVGAVTQTDFDGRILGSQILADASGNATVSIQHPVSPGTSTIAIDEVTGRHTGTLNQVFGAPLMASLQGGGADALTHQQLNVAIGGALGVLSTVGLSDAELALLANVEFEIQDLSGETLGLAAGDVIYVDIDGAGHGWFVDTTPGDNAEFLMSNPMNLGSSMGMGNGSDGPQGRMDLMTVVMHELGHVLGLDDLDPNVAPDRLMTGTLETGTRREIDSVDDLFGSLDLFNHLD